MWQSVSGRRRAPLAAAILAILLALLSVGPDAATAEPLSKTELLKLVRKNIEQSRLLAVVREVGVDFKFTPEVVEEFRAAGASAPLITALSKLSSSGPSGPAGAAVTAPTADEDREPRSRQSSVKTFSPQATATGPALESLKDTGERTIVATPAPAVVATAVPPGRASPPRRDAAAKQEEEVIDGSRNWHRIKPLLDEAEARARESDFRGAQKLVAKAMEIDPAEQRVHDAFKRLEADLVNRAQTFLAEGQVARALREFQFVLDKNPRSAPAYHGTGEVYMKMKNYDEAVAAFERALEMDPSNARYRRALTRAQSEQKGLKALEKSGQDNLKEMITDDAGRKKGSR